MSGAGPRHNKPPRLIALIGSSPARAARPRPVRGGRRDASARRSPGPGGRWGSSWSTGSPSTGGCGRPPRPARRSGRPSPTSARRARRLADVRPVRPGSATERAGRAATLPEGRSISSPRTRLASSSLTMAGGKLPDARQPPDGLRDGHRRPADLANNPVTRLPDGWRPSSPNAGASYGPAATPRSSATRTRTGATCSPARTSRGVAAGRARPEG